MESAMDNVNLDHLFRNADEILMAHPRNGFPMSKLARKAIKAALMRIAWGEDPKPPDIDAGNWPPEDPGLWLLGRTHKYVKAQDDPRYIKQAKLWFGEDERGYLQDPKWWGGKPDADEIIERLAGGVE
jgi:hypothetical protein